MEKFYAAGYDGVKKARMLARTEGIQLKLWWIRHLVTSNTPLHERMTLFWHNHFTSSNNKVLQPSLLYQQNQLFRKLALGNFGDLLRAVHKDPAMMVYLDGQMNQKGRINENFGRELLELFTLGIGHYQERDVKAASIAFTGWELDRAKPQVNFDPQQHEIKETVFLGKKDTFTADKIIDRLLESPYTARHIARKFWHEFISIENPPSSLINAWVKHFQQNNYDIKALLTIVFENSAFWTDKYRGNLIKSPVDLLLGSLRQLPYSAPNDAEIINTFKRLGQSLFDPPNVKGWSGGKAWLNTDTMLVRNAFLHQLARDDHDRKDYNRALPNASLNEINNWLLAVPPVLDLPVRQSTSQRVRSLLLDPAYQLR